MIIFTNRDNVEREILRNVKDSGVFESHDFHRLSKVMTIIKALASAVFLFVDQNLVRLQKSLHPHTSEEQDLHEYLKRRGSEWKEATRSRHNVRIGSKSMPLYNVPIQQGLTVSTNDGKIKFQLLESAILPHNTVVDSRGFYTIPMVVEALETGIRGNVAQDAISRIEDYIEDIDVVYNPDTTPLFVANERETIASVRERVRLLENESEGFMTREWYISETLKFPFVERVVFVSSKQLGIPGAIKLLVRGAGGLLSESQLNQIVDHFDSEDLNPGGSTKILADNILTVDVNRVFTVTFSAPESIPDSVFWDEFIDNYFFGLGQGDDFEILPFKSQILNIPDATEVVVDIDSDVLVADDYIAIPGPAFQIVGVSL